MALYLEIGDRGGETVTRMNLGIVFSSQGRFPEGQEQFGRSLALSRETGIREFEAGSTLNLGCALLFQGRLPEAQEQLERSLALSREIRSRVGEANALNNLGILQREEGESARSEEFQLSYLGMCAETGDRRAEREAYLELGSLRAARCRSEGGGGEGGRESLVRALDLAKDVGHPSVETMTRCELALLPGGDAHDALASYEEHGEWLSIEEHRSTRMLLWQATGDRVHLEAAKRLLDEQLAKVPDEYQEAMCTNLRVNREILAAWDAEFSDD